MPTVTERLTPGQSAPSFTLPDQYGRPLSLTDFAGRRLLLYAYPAALTPGCTKQAGDFRDNLALLTDSGLQVAGLSPDPVTRLARFAAAERLAFPLLSDPDRTALSAYGAYGPKQLYGKTVVGVIRSTFLIDADGRIERVWYAVKATGHVARLVRELALG